MPARGIADAQFDRARKPALAKFARNAGERGAQCARNPRTSREIDADCFLHISPDVEVRSSALREWSAPALAHGLLRVVDSLGTALLVLSEEGRVLFGNLRALSLLEQTRASLEGSLVGDLFGASVLAGTSDVLPDGRRTVRIRLPSKRLIDVGYTLSDVRFEEWTGRHMVLTFDDITQVRRLQDERDRLLKLATVGEALPSLLHELKNPLAAIASSVELLIEESSDEKQQADLHAVLGEVRRTTLSLDGMGSVGRNIVSRSLCAVDLAVREAVAILKSRAQRSGVTLACEVQTMPLLWLDAAVVRAAVFNLVANAISACDEGAGVHVGARLTNQGTRFELTVVDSGSGMSREVLARATELFFTTKRSGSGIGLALCKQIAEDAGGALSIESTPGHGTRVALSIPIPTSPASSGAPAAE